MAITAKDLKFHHTATGANSTASSNLGGARQSLEIDSQIATFTTAVSGVVISRAGGCSESLACNLQYVSVGQTLAYKDNADTSFGTAVPVGAGGTFLLQGVNKGTLTVTVTPASLPGANVTGIFTFLAANGYVFANVQKAEAIAGSVKYRCIYLYNGSTTDAFLSVNPFLESQPVAGDTLAIGLDPAGNGNGTSTGVATTIANENTAPAGVTFSTPTSGPTGLAVGALASLTGRALWIRRTVPALSVGTVPDDFSHIGAQVSY